MYTFIGHHLVTVRLIPYMGCTLFITRVPKRGKCVWNWDTEALVLDPSHYYREGLLYLAAADSLEN